LQINLNKFKDFIFNCSLGYLYHITCIVFCITFRTVLYSFRLAYQMFRCCNRW